MMVSDSGTTHYGGLCMETFVQDAKGYNIYKIQTNLVKPNFHKIMAGFFSYDVCFFGLLTKLYETWHLLAP